MACKDYPKFKRPIDSFKQKRKKHTRKWEREKRKGYRIERAIREKENG